MTTLKTTMLNVLTVAILGSATACSSTTGPAGPPPPPPPPEPRFKTVYDLDLETRYIRVQGSCDEDFLGNSTPGEFQYKIVVKGEGQSGTQASKGYNSVTGASFQRNAGTDINFANRTYSWRSLASTSGIEVELRGAEWDAVSKDGRMADRAGSETVPFKLGKETYRVIIGATSKCQIRLFYDARWTERQIPAS